MALRAQPGLEARDESVLVMQAVPLHEAVAECRNRDRFVGLKACRGGKTQREYRPEEGGDLALRQGRSISCACESDLEAVHV